MRGQRGCASRGWAAAGAALVLTGSLAGCASEDDASLPRAQRDAGTTPAAELAMAPAAVTPGLLPPEWLPPALPLPEGASVTAVGTLSCTVNFLVPTSDAQVQGGAVGARARANGLQVELVSSVTSTEPVDQPVSDFPGFEEEEIPVEPVVTQVEVLRIKDAAGGADGPPVDATLTLTSRGDGVVTGEYALADGTCSR